MSELTVPASLSGARLDSAAATLFDLSRSAVTRYIESGDLTVNGMPAEKKTAVSEGDVLSLDLPAPTEMTAAEPENIPLDIVYEDKDLLVINKPVGMVVHPAPGNEHGTLVNALLYHCRGELSGIGGVMRPGIVHRIDKDTSGLLVVAKNDPTHRALAAMLEGHHIARTYFALANGGFSDDSGTVNAPIGRHPTDRKRMAVIRDGSHTAREAVTHYEVLERFGPITFLRLRLETGRTHQIRVHLSSLGHPLLGDTTYGGGRTAFEKTHARLLCGQALHAGELDFVHPTTGKPVHFEAPLPPEMTELLRILREK